jgi:energy-converting hydrogenase Eha subunit H
MILRRSTSSAVACLAALCGCGVRGAAAGQLLRLSLFQVSVGMATVLLLGTLNRVMIVELSVPAMVVALMIALPVLVAPFRALLGSGRTPIARPSGGSGCPTCGSARSGRWAGWRSCPSR